MTDRFFEAEWSSSSNDIESNDASLSGGSGGELEPRRENGNDSANDQSVSLVTVAMRDVDQAATANFTFIESNLQSFMPVHDSIVGGDDGSTINLQRDAAANSTLSSSADGSAPFENAVSVEKSDVDVEGSSHIELIAFESHGKTSNEADKADSTVSVGVKVDSTALEITALSSRSTIASPTMQLLLQTPSDLAMPFRAAPQRAVDSTRESVPAVLASTVTPLDASSIKDEVPQPVVVASELARLSRAPDFFGD